MKNPFMEVEGGGINEEGGKKFGRGMEKFNHLTTSVSLKEGDNLALEWRGVLLKMFNRNNPDYFF